MPAIRNNESELLILGLIDSINILESWSNIRLSAISFPSSEGPKSYQREGQLHGERISQCENYLVYQHNPIYRAWRNYERIKNKLPSATRAAPRLSVVSWVFPEDVYCLFSPSVAAVYRRTHVVQSHLLSKKRGKRQSVVTPLFIHPFS